ncbi:MAG: helix-turn-helix domain-containing protein [Candidatus Freyrarchaeum guaymaensis]
MKVSVVEKGLSAEGRLKLLRALVGHGESLTMGQLSRITGLHVATVHRHLKTLVEAGLVVRRNVAGEIRFSVDTSSRVGEKLVQFLGELIHHDILLGLSVIEGSLETRKGLWEARRTLENLFRWYPHILKEEYGSDVAELAVELGETLERR